jgi:hypothetical protein
MGFGYLGSTVMTPLIGVFLRNVDVGLFPVLVLLCVGAVVLFTERLNRLTTK